MRARVMVEEGRAGRMSLVATEIPFQVTSRRCSRRSRTWCATGRSSGISDLRDESDRDGMRIVIELKKDANPKVVLNQLFVHSPLQTTFGAIMLGLVNNRPQVLTLRALIDQYIAAPPDRRAPPHRVRPRRGRAPRAHPRGAQDRARPSRRGDHADPRGEGRRDRAPGIDVDRSSSREIQANAILEMRLAAADRSRAREDRAGVPRGHPADRAAPEHARERAEDAGNHQGRGAPAARQVRRRAPHADRGRGRRHRLRGHDRAEGHGDHDLARGLHQAAGGHRLSLAAPRRQGRDRRAHQGRGLHRAPVHREHARLSC